MKYSLSASTFNAAGVHKNSIAGFYAFHGSTSAIKAYHFQYDVVTWAQRATSVPNALGMQIQLQPTFHIENGNIDHHFQAHGIDEIIKSLDRL
jgi:hypothetical protein